MLRETSLRLLLKKNKEFLLPRYQRGYAWKPGNVDDFWDDLVASVEQDHTHFFGIIYLQETNGKSRIMDGQQRMTTTMLFVWCVREYLQRTKIGKTKIKNLDGTIRVNGKLRLTLSKTNNTFFQNLLNKKFATQGDLSDAIDNDSNRDLFSAYNRLRSNIGDYGKKHGSDSVIGLVDHLLDEFSLYVISTTTYDAHTMFNLINNRGLSLAQHDLIRSYVFGELDKNPEVTDELSDEIDEYWREIMQHIKKGPNFSLNVFFQHVLNLTGGEFLFVKDKDIYEMVCKRVNDKQIPTWVPNVRDWSKVVYNLRTPKGHFLDYARKSQPCEAHLERIRKIRASAVYPLLMAGYKIYWLNEDYKSFNKLTEACFKYHLRAQTIGKADVGKYQRHIGKVAHNFYNNGSLDVNDIIKSLKADLYLSEGKLRALLIGYEPHIPIATVLLELIEERHSDKLSHTSVTVEHVMPKTLNDAWRDYISERHLDCSKDEAERVHKTYHNYLGNLTLLNKGENSKGKNDSFEIKKNLYKQTDYKITNELAELSHWGEDEIKNRHSCLVSEIIKILN